MLAIITGDFKAEINVYKYIYIYALFTWTYAFYMSLVLSQRVHIGYNCKSVPPVRIGQNLNGYTSYEHNSFGVLIAFKVKVMVKWIT